MKLGIAVACLGIVGCVKIPVRYAPPTITPADRSPRSVAASFDRTWDAAVDVFAANGLSVVTANKASGVLASGVSVYSKENPDSTLADCGTEYPKTPEWRKPLAVLNGRVNVVIRSDREGSTVLARAFFNSSITPGEIIECPSRGTLEARIEQAIANRAIGK